MDAEKSAKLAKLLRENGEHAIREGFGPFDFVPTKYVQMELDIERLLEVVIGLEKKIAYLWEEIARLRDASEAS